MNPVSRVLRWPALALIRGYQLVISPWTGASCRFSPSCSAYAYEAIATHGLIRGTLLAVRRLGRCHPWNPGGIDPVPPGRSARRTAARGA